MRTGRTAPSPGDALPTLGHYVAHVRRHLGLLLALCLVGGAVGAAVHLTGPRSYHATSSIALAPRLVYVPGETEQAADREVTLDTVAGLARSDTVVNAVQEITGLTADQVRAGLTLAARPASRVLVIGFRSESRATALAAGHAAVEALLAVQDRALALSAEQVQLLRNRVNVLAAQAQERIQEGTDAAAVFESQVLLQRRLDRTVASAEATSTVLRRSEVVASRSGDPAVHVTTGLGLGLLLALTLAGPLSGGAPARLDPRERQTHP
ncbi:hypothetical protein [Nocardioides pantholopis]|uniref:hypothetical protein n=1 Tax=Nocardioides pantholopis TaxID=2483798 RepID=UPI000FD9BB08|nr:hypothetical protein [Nocardioides pantholopis]